MVCQIASSPGSCFSRRALRQRSAKGPTVTSKAPWVSSPYALAWRRTAKVSLSTGTGSLPA